MAMNGKSIPVNIIIRHNIFSEIIAERSRQDSIHPGESGFPKDLRLAILVEEVGEVGKAICELKPDEMRTELIQVAAVAIRWLELIDHEHCENLKIEEVVKNDCNC